MKDNREFLKTYWWEDVFFTDLKTEKQRKIPHPPLQKEYPKDAELIDLVNPEEFTLGDQSLIDLIGSRVSRRKFTNESLSLEELSFLLWATQGVNKITRQGSATQRTVPSGGSRHPFETYLAVFLVDGLKQGLYRYLALEHKLYLVDEIENLGKKLGKACMNQRFVGKCAVTFIWTAIPYRTEWSYDKVSHKIIAQDSGHMCQNLYLAAEAIGAGTCAIGAFHQDETDSLIGVDGEEEFTVYIAPVGKVSSS
jgi:SagB-type dehydrogenase family enzyme